MNRYRWWIGALLAFACRADERQPARPGDTNALDTMTAVQRSWEHMGVVFDPATLKRGARVGTLVADSIGTTLVERESTYVGSVRFLGEIELSGRTIKHFDADSRAICFEADSASAMRLPRWKGDTRRPWFCFDDIAGAEELLGPPGLERPARVTIADFTIHRSLSDAVNSARLVRADSVIR